MPSTKTFLRKLIGGRRAARGGSVRFVTGDLLDANLCPGPFHVVLERKTLQLFSNEDRPAAMRALASRLTTPGIFFTHSHRNVPFSVSGEGSPCHWFNAQHWPLWEGGTPLETRVAWLSTSSG